MHSGSTLTWFKRFIYYIISYVLYRHFHIYINVLEQENPHTQKLIGGGHKNENRLSHSFRNTFRDLGVECGRSLFRESDIFEYIT